VIETVYTALLVVVFFVIMWFAGYVIYKLFHGQR
jgi:predicted secreted protein